MQETYLIRFAFADPPEVLLHDVPEAPLPGLGDGVVPGSTDEVVQGVAELRTNTPRTITAARLVGNYMMPGGRATGQHRHTRKKSAAISGYIS